MDNLQKAIYEVKVLRKTYRETAVKYGIAYHKLYHQANIKNVSKAVDQSLLTDDEQKSLMLHLKECVDRGSSVTPKDIIDEAYKILRSRLGENIKKPNCTWLENFLKDHGLSTVIDEYSKAIVPADDIITWFVDENITFELNRQLGLSEDHQSVQESFTLLVVSQNDTVNIKSLEEEVFRNHKSKCRLCIENVPRCKIDIAEDVRDLILELQLEVCLSLIQVFSDFFFCLFCS